MTLEETKAAIKQALASRIVGDNYLLNDSMFDDAIKIAHDAGQIVGAEFARREAVAGFDRVLAAATALEGGTA